MGTFALAFKIISLLSNLVPLILHAESVYRAAGAGPEKKAFVVKQLGADAAAAIVAAQTGGLIQDAHLGEKIDAGQTALGGLVDAAVGILHAVGVFSHTPPGGESPHNA